MAFETRRQRGCGCCGTWGCIGVLLLIILLGVAGFFAVRITWNLYETASDQPLPVSRSEVSPGAYSQARGKLNNFMSNSEIRSVSLSEVEVNALLEDAPELTFLAKGATIALRENEAELRFRVPLQLLLFNTKYLNYEVFLRPIVSWGKVTVNVSRVTSAGKALDPTTLRGFKEQVEPILNQVLSWLNETRQSREIQSIRIQGGSVLLER
jgi:hypothetical protein